MEQKRPTPLPSILPEPLRGSITLLLIRIFLVMAGTDAVYLTIRITLFELNPQWINGTATDISFFIFLAFSYIVQIFFIYFVLLHWLNKKYYIETTHLIVRSGVFTTRERIYDLKNMKSLSVTQDFFGKIFHYGGISMVISAPGLTEDIFLPEIPHPHKLEIQLKKFL